MNLPLLVARRYLFAKKTRQVINVISWVSAAGIALGTMALVVVLSVYNGFDRLVEGLYHSFDPDIVIRPVEGKTFIPDARFDQVRDLPAVQAYCPVIEENIFLRYRGKQSIGTVKGVDSVFTAHTPLGENITHGYFQLYFGELEQAVLGRGLALNLGVNVNFVDPLWIYFPKREAHFSAINPMASLNQEKLFPAGIFSVEQQFDANYLFVPLATVRRLLDYDSELTSVELRLAPGAKAKKVVKAVRQCLGPSFQVLDRYRQNPTLYKMMRTEKLAIFCILSFIILVISCNVLASLSLLLIEKQQDVFILQSMGATPALVRRIFRLEGWLISLLGWAVGMVLGLLLCFIQYRFGVIPMPGNFAVKAYPVVVSFADMLSVTAIVFFLGGLAAFFPTRKIVSL